MVNLDLVVCGR